MRPNLQTSLLKSVQLTNDVPPLDFPLSPCYISEQCKLMHPGNHKLLQLEFKQPSESKATDSTSEMDTTENGDSNNKPDFQRVGEFAQMG